MGHAYDNGWDTKPKIDEARVRSPEVPKHHNQRDRKRWCRGKPGVEHRPELRRSKSWDRYKQWHGAGCLWWPYGRLGWVCGHEIGCAECGRILTRRLHGSECPDFEPR
ncbi:MAG: hypothetical protein ACRDRY_24670 [Pseudonocardiaceae bacterium]